MANTLNNKSKEGEPPTDQEMQALSDFEENYRTKPGAEKNTRNAKNQTKFKGIKSSIFFQSDRLPKNSLILWVFITLIVDLMDQTLK